MRGGGSSPSILSGSPEAEDDCGIYTEPFTYSNWIFISDLDEIKVWQKSNTPDSASQGKTTFFLKKKKLQGDIYLCFLSRKQKSFDGQLINLSLW